MKSMLMKALPHVSAVLIFLIISSLFFKLENSDYGLRQGDIQHVMGMSKELVDYRMMNNTEEALWSNNMFGGMPGYQTNLLYPSNLLKPIDAFLKLYQDPATGVLFMCMLGFYIFCLCVRINPWLGIAGGLAFGLSTINVLYLGAGHTSKVNAISYMAPVLGGVILAYRGKWLLGSAVFALFFGLHIAASHLQMTYYLAFLLGAVALGEVARLIIQKNLRNAILASTGLLVAGVIAVLPNIGSLITTYEYSELTTRGKTEITIKPEDVRPELALLSDQTKEKEGTKTQSGLDPDYILQYNMSGREWMSTFLPNAKGGSSAYIKKDKDALKKVPAKMREDIGNMNHYWGDQDSSGGAFYFGAFIMFVFVLALIFSRDNIKWAFLIITLLAIGLSVKEFTGLNKFFIEDFPFYNKFRDHKMMLVLLQIMAPALALIFIDDLLKNTLTDKMKKAMLIGTGVLTLVGIAICFSPKAAGSLLSKNDEAMFAGYEEQYADDPATMARVEDLQEALVQIRAVIYKEDGQRSMLLIVFAALILVTLIYKKAPWYVVVPVVVLVIAGDMWTVSTRYMNADKEEGSYRHYEKIAEKYFPYAPDACDMSILEKEKGNIAEFENKVSELKNQYLATKPYSKIKDKTLHEVAAQFGTLQLNTDYRVLLASRGVFTDASIPYFHKSLGGYHAAKLKRYQEMIDFHITPQLNQFTDALQSRNLAKVDSVTAGLTMLNMLNTKYIKFSPEAPPMENRHNLGAAWFVSEIKSVPTADEEMKALLTFDPSREAIVNASFSTSAKSATVDSSASIDLVEYGTKYLKYQSKSSQDAPAIFSEIYYPTGWICRIDNQEVPYFCANYILRGVMVPAGDHTIEWSFEPASYAKGVKVNWIGSFILLAFVLLIFGLQLVQNFRGSAPVKTP
ncbi:MAG: hypothetical protein ACKVOK_00950 [Flavobacteriales bacterium]